MELLLVLDDFLKDGLLHCMQWDFVTHSVVLNNTFNKTDLHAMSLSTSMVSPSMVTGLTFCSSYIEKLINYKNY